MLSRNGEAGIEQKPKHTRKAFGFVRENRGTLVDLVDLGNLTVC